MKRGIILAVMFIGLVAFTVQRPLKLNCIIQPPDSDTIVWRSDIILSWMDFKGIPNAKSSHNAMSNVASYCKYSYVGDTLRIITKTLFFKGYSWVKPLSNQGHKDIILNHEKLHFDIAEVYTRKLRETMSRMKFEKQAVGDQVKIIYADIRKQLIETQARYDKETEHSLNVVKQEEWVKNIKLQLKATVFWEDKSEIIRLLK